MLIANVIPLIYMDRYQGILLFEIVFYSLIYPLKCPFQVTENLS